MITPCTAPYRTLLDVICPKNGWWEFWKEDNSNLADVQKLREIFKQALPAEKNEIMDRVNTRRNELRDLTKTTYALSESLMKTKRISSNLVKYAERIENLTAAYVEFCESNPEQTNSKVDLLQQMVAYICLSMGTQERVNEFLELFSDFTEKQLTAELFDSIQALFFNLGRQSFTIVTYLKNLPPETKDSDDSSSGQAHTRAERRCKLMTLALPFLTKLSNAQERINLLEVLCSIPRLQIDDVCIKAGRLVGQLPYIQQRTAAILLIKTLPLGHRTKDVLSLLPSMIKKTNSIKKLYEGIKFISAEDRAETIELIAPLYRDNNVINFRCEELLEALAYIPKKDRSDTLVNALVVLLARNEGDHRILLDNLMGGIADSERASALIQGIRFQMHSKQMKAFCIRALAMVPCANRTTAVISAIPSLFNNMKEIKETELIFNSLSLLEPAEVGNVIVKAQNDLNKISLSCLKAGMLLAYSKIGDPQMLAHPHNMINQLSTVNQKYAAMIFLALHHGKEISPSQIPLLVYQFGSKIKDPLAVLLALNGVPAAARDPYKMSWILLQIIEQVCEVKHDHFFFLYLLPSSCYFKASQLIATAANNADQTFNGYVTTILKETAIKEAIRKHLGFLLDVPLEHFLKNKLCDYVVLLREKLGLENDQDPIMQKVFAGAYQCLTSEKKQDLHIPYTLYFKLKKYAEDEPYIDVPIVNENIDGQDFNWNLSSIRKKAVWSHYTVDDLPTGVSIVVLQKMFNEMAIRLNKLNDTEKLSVMKEISTIIYGNQLISNQTRNNSYNIIRDNLLHNNYIQALLETPSITDNNIVSNEKFQLFACVKSILDSDAVLKRNERMSEREYNLIKFANNIQECVIGRVDGIMRYYVDLPITYKKGSLKGGEDRRSKVEEFLEVVYQAEVKTVLNQESLIAELSGVLPGNLQNQSHQSLYLINRLGKHLGSNEPIRYDGYNNIIHENILMGKPTDQYTATIKRLLISNFIKSLLNKAKEGFKEYCLYQGMADILGIIETDLQPQGYINYDEDADILTLTIKGAVVLAHKFGYIDKIHI